MTKKELLYVENREMWRKWLSKNAKTKKEIWLIYFKKHTGKPSVPYEDAVQEAVCFGWIDSTVNKLDEERFIQRYTPRNPKSLWSQSNITRAEKMIKVGKMQPSGLQLYRDAMGKTLIAPAIGEAPVPKDLEAALQKVPKAWENFNNLSDSYKTLNIYWINDAKRPETRKTRIEKSVIAASQNKKLFNM